MESKEQQELAEKLLKIDLETFKLAGEIFINTDIKICKTPVFKPAIFNLNLLKEMNIAQLKFLLGLVYNELEKRDDK